jgi:hypothetical protein
LLLLLLFWVKTREFNFHYCSKQQGWRSSFVESNTVYATWSQLLEPNLHLPPLYGQLVKYYESKRAKNQVQWDCSLQCNVNYTWEVTFDRARAQVVRAESTCSDVLSIYPNGPGKIWIPSHVMLPMAPCNKQLHCTRFQPKFRAYYPVWSIGKLPPFDWWVITKDYTLFYTDKSQTLRVSWGDPKKTK